MPAPILARDFADLSDEPRPVRVAYARVEERAVYQSRRLSPGSAVAALTLAAAAFSSFQYLGGLSPSHRQERRLTVVTLADLKPPPPPAPEKQPETQTDVPHRQSPVVAPAPIVATPVPAPTIAVAEVPAPPSPAPIAAKPTEVKPDPGPSAPSTAATEGGDLSSKMISAKPPTYPLDSRRLREQGTVILSVLLAIDGHVERLSIARSSGFPRLDRAAAGAVRHWRWSPTVRDGQPVLVQGNVVIPFVLQG